MNMEENAQNTQQEENPNEPLLPPIIELFREPSIKFFQVMDNFSDKWDDASSAHFKEEVVEHSRRVSYDYIHSVLNLANNYEYLLQQAQSLLGWKAGFGGWLSITDIAMLVDRQTSRFCFGRDDQRW